jgi:hypothetical protein
MDVAIAFAVSWKPFVKSNMRAVRMTAITMTDMGESPSRITTDGTTLRHGWDNAGR